MTHVDGSERRSRRRSFRRRSRQLATSAGALHTRSRTRCRQMEVLVSMSATSAVVFAPENQVEKNGTQVPTARL